MPVLNKVYIVNPSYNNIEYNDDLVKAIWCLGIDYFLRKIRITSLFQLLLGFKKNFDSFVNKSL